METREIKTEVVRNGDQQGEVGRDQPGYARTSQEGAGGSGVSGRVRENEQGTSRVLQSHRGKNAVEEIISKRAAEYGTTATLEDARTWTRKDPAYTDTSGNVHIRGDISPDILNQLLEHEMNHVLKRKDYQPYLKFVNSVPEAVDFTSWAGSVLVKEAAYHRKIDIRRRLTAEQIKTISDEIAAMVRGAEMSGHVEDILGDLREAFDDYNAFASELAKIHEQYVKDVAEEKRREESKS